MGASSPYLSPSTWCSIGHLSFRLIPYWIFNDKILHFLGGGIAIALVYEYFVLNFNIRDGEGIISLRKVRESRIGYLLANLFLLTFFLLFLLQRFLRALRVRLEIRRGLSVR